MHWLIEPLTADFFVRALLGGALAAALGAVVGVWVVVRGMAFLGEALAHGMLPGVAVATLTGLPPVLGAAVSALVMSLGIGSLARRTRLADDTTIGIVFVGMLALGVGIVSQSRSFAVDLTAMLFGDVLAIREAELWLLAAGLTATLLVAAFGHRAFLALALDERLAQTMGMRPRLARTALVCLVTLAVVVSYQAVGTLLVVGLLLAPAAAAGFWTRRIPSRMLLAAVLGTAAVIAGLYASWHAAIAAGPAIAGAAVLTFAVSAGASAVRRVLGRPPAAQPEPHVPAPPRAATASTPAPVTEISS